MIPVVCKNCGKKSKVKRIRIEKKLTDPDHFYCHDCNSHLHRVLKHPDMSVKHKLEFYAALYRSKQKCQKD